jgi:hypothetical protein
LRAVPKQHYLWPVQPAPYIFSESKCRYWQLAIDAECTKMKRINDNICYRIKKNQLGFFFKIGKDWSIESDWVENQNLESRRIVS